MTPECIGLESTTSSDHSLSRAQAWVEECANEHDGCGRGYDNPRYTPTRLIFIGTEGNHWSLVEGLELDGKASCSRYVTLSYMWGDHQQLLLRESNVSQFRIGYPISELPRTFRDLVYVARRLKVEYLWIDALCIVQDSKQDWEAESLRMRAVYANSYCTVAASWGIDPTKGLFTTRNVDDIRCGIFQRPCQGNQERMEPLTIRLHEKGAWDEIIEFSPLHHRGWVIQERYLSPRILYFTVEQILFECDTHVRCETFQSEVPQNYQSELPQSYQSELSQGYTDSVRPRFRIHTWSGHHNDCVTRIPEKKELPIDTTFFEGWAHIVSQYSACGLTKKSDRLRAISGLADVFANISGDEYIAGLWRFHIWSSLLWRTTSPKSTTNHDYAPSYSWGAVDCEVSWRFIKQGAVQFHPFQFLDGNSRRMSLYGFGPMYDPQGSERYEEFVTDTLDAKMWLDERDSICYGSCGFPIYFLVLRVESEQYTREPRKDILEGIVVQALSDVDTDNCLQCIRVGYFKSMSHPRLAPFGLYMDVDGNVQEQEGLKKIQFVLR